MSSTDAYRWVSAGESCQIWDEKFNSIHNFDEVLGNNFPEQIVGLTFTNQMSFISRNCC